MNYENMSNCELLKRYQRDGTIGHELKARLRRCLDMDDCECDRLRAELAAERAFLADLLVRLNNSYDDVNERYSFSEISNIIASLELHP